VDSRQSALPEGPGASGRLLFALALLAGALLRLVQLGVPDLFGPDEGPWAVGARNLVEGGFEQFLALSRAPFGSPSGTPVFFPALLSLVVRVFGAEEWAIRLPSVFAGLVGAFVLERIVRRSYGQPAGHLAGAFAALLPPLVSASRAASAEPALVALGLGGIIFGLRAFEEDSPLDGAVAGALFGLGFLTKGHAVGLFLAPLAVALFARPRVLSLGRSRASLAALAGTFLAVGGSHLGLIAALRPAAFSFQFRSAFGAAGDWTRGSLEPTAFGTDLRTLVGTLFLFLPLAGVGIAYLFRGVGEEEAASGATTGERRLSHTLLWAAYGTELVIAVAASGTLQLSTTLVMPAMAAFAGFGSAALLSPPENPGRRRAEIGAAISAGLVVLAAAAYLMAFPNDPLFGGRQAPLSSGAVLASIAATAAGAVFLLSRRAGSRLSGRLALAALSALLVAAGVESAGFIRRDLLTHRVGIREIANQIAPLVARRSPGELSFVAPDPDALAFHLFRRGRTWAGIEGLAQAAEGSPAFWVTRGAGPVGSGMPPRLVHDWLESATDEVTAQVEARAGRRLGLRVFVSRGPSPPPS
jgi:4-amino-4-deoxy-L-arabinose transferase-like glycosyltransferase